MWPRVGVGVGVGVGDVTVAGVELNNNTALATQSEQRFLDSKVTLAGVELNNNTALTTQSERRFLDSKPVEFPRNTTKMRNNSLQKWRNCGWSETQQQHSKHETKRTAILMTSKPVEFSQ
jgi:hypothetical protein